MVVMKMGHPRLLWYGGHLIGGDVWGAPWIQGNHRVGVGGSLLSSHVKAGGGAGAVVLSPLEGTGVLVQLGWRVVLILGVHGSDNELGTA